MKDYSNAEELLVESLKVTERQLSETIYEMQEVTHSHGELAFLAGKISAMQALKESLIMIQQYEE